MLDLVLVGAMMFVPVLLLGAANWYLDRKELAAERQRQRQEQEKHRATIETVTEKGAR